MKKLLFLGIVLLLNSCDLKDKNGNAPLVADENGNLVDNPNYIDEKDEGKAERIAEYKKTWDDDYDETATPSVESRENFVETFQPTAGGKDMKLSGKDKTTITFTSPFNTDYTAEQFINLDYFGKLRNMGFKKVILSNGEKSVYEKDL